MSKYPEQEEDIKKADEASRILATHLFNMGAARIEEDINIFETPDTFRLVLKRVSSKETPSGEELNLLDILEFAEGALLDALTSDSGPREGSDEVLKMISAALIANNRTSVLQEVSKWSYTPVASASMPRVVCWLLARIAR